MRCYNCGMALSEKDYCTGCGSDVRLYKKIVYTSNRLYNEGLEKAQVRNLSGAAESLRECLKLNKNNIEARNLLGLVYYECGEVASALAEWVVSRSMRPKKNLADDYLSAIQNNPAVIAQMNQMVKKYNLALAYSEQGGYDIAIIQLKKVLTLNPQFLKARQLLALLYIQDGNYQKAKAELEAALKVDAGNLLTVRYLKEVKEQAPSEEAPKKEEARTYKVDNQTIIQPINRRERTIFTTAVNLIIGIALGVALSWYCIMPNRIDSARHASDSQLVSISEQLDSKTSRISQLQKEIEEQKSDNILLREEIAQYEGTDTVMEELKKLLLAADTFADTELGVTEKAVAILNLDEERLMTIEDASYINLYRKMYNAVAMDAAVEFYNEGLAAFRNGDYEKAVTELEYAATFNPEDAYVWYNLGKSCRLGGDAGRAVEAFQKVIELVPGSERAKQSQVYINELS